MYSKITIKCHSCNNEFVRYSNDFTTNNPLEINCPYCYNCINPEWIERITDIALTLDDINSKLFHHNYSKNVQIPFTISLEPCLSPKDIEALNSED